MFEIVNTAFAELVSNDQMEVQYLDVHVFVIDMCMSVTYVHICSNLETTITRLLIDSFVMNQMHNNYNSDRPTSQLLMYLAFHTIPFWCLCRDRRGGVLLELKLLLLYKWLTKR
mgnify:CR=1 FL=1